VLDTRPGWASVVAGPLATHDIPGSHGTMTEPPNADVFARHLRAAIEAALSPGRIAVGGMIARARAVADLPEPGGVALALSDCDVAPEALAACYALLDREERNRASRFRFARDRDRYVARRANCARCWPLKSTGRPLPCASWKIPMGAVSGRSPRPAFSTCRIPTAGRYSRSRMASASAATWNGATPNSLPQGRARLFAPAECARWTRWPQEHRSRWILQLLTRKEAFVKRLAWACPIRSMPSPCRSPPGEPARLIEGGAGWSLSSFEPAPGFQAALVKGEADRPSAG